MDEIAEAIYQFGERHRKGILIACAIIFALGLVGMGALENGLI